MAEIQSTLFDDIKQVKDDDKKSKEDVKTKVCSKCGKELPAITEFFHKHKGGLYGLKSYCKQCKSKQRKKYHLINKNNYNKKEREKYQKQKQEKACKTCGRIFRQNKKSCLQYCSQECAGKRTTLKCMICGKEFTRATSKISKYCSRKCSDIAQSKKIKQICIVCGKEFYIYPCILKKGYGKYCSQECRKKQIKSICQYCGKEFYQKISLNKKYCSKKCANLSKKTGKYKICPTCGKEFYITKERAEKNKIHYCSVECMKRKVKRQCKRCGKEFYVVQGEANRGGGKYCSKKCFAKDYRGVHYLGLASFETYSNRIIYAEKTRRSPGNNNAMQVKCTYCGKWFNPSPSMVQNRIRSLNGELSGEHRFYCSEGCKQSCPIYGRNMFPKGFKKATSREVAPELRQMCFERDSWECQKCGASIQDATLHCHHIKGYAQNKILANDIDNVITLCKSCHKEVHSQEGCKYHELRCNNE